jgi:DcmR-like sensory protein/putative zinc finger protein
MTSWQTNDISCADIWHEVSNYVDGTSSVEWKHRIEDHLRNCPECRSVVAGTANTVKLMDAWGGYDLPAGFSDRLRDKLSVADRDGTPPLLKRSVPLGFGRGKIELGTHLVYFSNSDVEFKRGVQFLQPALKSERDHCVIFGHTAANNAVLSCIRAMGHDPEVLIAAKRLTVLPRQLTAKLTLAKIASVFEEAVARGATTIRYLGNLGVSREKWPGSGEQDVLELECKVTAVAERFPCVVLCMYDVSTLPARMVLRGGFETHPIVIWGETPRSNPYCTSDPDVIAGVTHSH